MQLGELSPAGGCAADESALRIMVESGGVRMAGEIPVFVPPKQPRRPGGNKWLVMKAGGGAQDALMWIFQFKSLGIRAESFCAVSPLKFELASAASSSGGAFTVLETGVSGWHALGRSFWKL